jgi:hypothetical protein
MSQLGQVQTNASQQTASGSGCCRPPGDVARCEGASLSDAAGTFGRRCSPRRIGARLIGQRLSERLGQQFIIQNRPGAGSNLGAEAVVHAPPDSYTLLLIGGPNL